MRYKIFSFAAILVSGASALRDAVARRWQAMVRQTAAYGALAAIDAQIADQWATTPGLTCAQRTRAMEEAVRALITGSVQTEVAGGACPASSG
jgi:hypothetical protein